MWWLGVAISGLLLPTFLRSTTLFTVSSLFLSSSLSQSAKLHPLFLIFQCLLRGSWSSSRVRCFGWWFVSLVAGQGTLPSCLLSCLPSSLAGNARFLFLILRFLVHLRCYSQALLFLISQIILLLSHTCVLVPCFSLVTGCTYHWHCSFESPWLLWSPLSCVSWSLLFLLTIFPYLSSIYRFLPLTWPLPSPVLSWPFLLSPLSPSPFFLGLVRTPYFAFLRFSKALSWSSQHCCARRWLLAQADVSFPVIFCFPLWTLW